MFAFSHEASFKKELEARAERRFRRPITNCRNAALGRFPVSRTTNTTQTDLLYCIFNLNRNLLRRPQCLMYRKNAPYDEFKWFFAALPSSRRPSATTGLPHPGASADRCCVTEEYVRDISIRGTRLCLHNKNWREGISFCWDPIFERDLDTYDGRACFWYSKRN